MGINRIYEQRLLLFHCVSTCIYVPAILMLPKINESIFEAGSFEFTLILTIVVAAEVLKLLFSMTRSQYPGLGRIDSRQSSKKSWSKGLKEISKFSVAILLLFVVYWVTAVLFGAPVFTQHKETAMLSLTLSILTFVPACLHLGIDAALAILTTPHYQGVGLISQALSLNVKTTLLGSWAGAVVIPLDWDRPWQAWPVPCMLGAFAGYVFGHVATIVKIFLVLRLGKKGQR